MIPLLSFMNWKITFWHSLKIKSPAFRVNLWLMLAFGLAPYLFAKKMLLVFYFYISLFFTIFILIPWEYPYSSWVRTFALLSRAIDRPSHTPTAYASRMVMRIRAQPLGQSDHHAWAFSTSMRTYANTHMPRASTEHTRHHATSRKGYIFRIHFFCLINPSLVITPFRVGGIKAWLGAVSRSNRNLTIS